MKKQATILEVDNLSVDFLVEGSWVSAVNNVSFSLEEGEILALVGESGCGKSVTCLSLAKLVDNTVGKYSSGTIKLRDTYGEQNILDLKKRQLREIRGKKIGYIFQEPSVSLNPVYKVGDQVAEAITNNRKDVVNVKDEIISLFKLVGISEPEQRIYCYPHELSGGMQQRVMIAMALAGKPDILVADEPTTALDVTIQAQIIKLLYDIRKKTNMSIIIVSHNLGVVSELADKIIVMYAGQIVEQAPISKILKLKHPYAKALLKAIPRIGHSGDELTSIPGNVPSPGDYPQGCRFHNRCQVFINLTEEQQSKCIQDLPDLNEYDDASFCRCHFINIT